MDTRPTPIMINVAKSYITAGAGVTIQLSRNVKLDARYRYFATNVTVDTVLKATDY